MNRPDPNRASDNARPGTSRSFELAFPKEIFLAAVERLAPSRASKPGVTALAPYLEHYRADAFTEDFLSLTTEDAATLALDLWEFNIANQESDARVIRVRPALAANGKPLRFDVAEIVGPDLAFLVDSAINACQEARVEIRAVLHPVMPGPHGKRSLIQIHLPQMDDAHRADLARVLEETFSDVANVNADHVAMKAKMEAAAASLSALKATPERSADDIKEARDFLAWLAQDHFTFLGARDYTYARGKRGELSAEEPIVDEASGLGILRDQNRNVLSRGAEPTVLSPAVRAFLNEPQPLIVAKASFLSRVHRRAHADYVGVKRYDARGEVVGETRFVGLYTSSAYTKAASDVPLIRRKIEHVKQSFASDSRFAQRRLDAVLQTYPRDELFQISEDDLARIARGVLQLQIRPRTQLFIRRDRFDRYISALLYVPRDSYNSELRTRAHKILADAYGGRAAAYYPSFNDGPLARVHLIVRVRPGHAEPDEDSLDLQMRQLFETWEGALGRFARSTNADLGPVDEARFTAAYKEMFAPQEGLADIAAIMSMGESQTTKARAWGADFNANAQHLKIYHRDGPLDLSEIVPVLERLGLRAKAEANFPIRFQPTAVGPSVVERPGFEAPGFDPPAKPNPERLFYVHDLTLERLPSQRPLEKKFEEAFEAVFARLTENDRFNSLVVALGVDWRSAALLRTLARWRAQSGLDPSEPVQVQALRDYPEIAMQLLKLFAIKFDPGMPGDIAARKLAAEPVSKKIDQLLETVSTLDADRVLRRLTQLVRAVQRTNFYLAEPGQTPDRHIAIKIASPEADPLPAPRPFREIFVWSPDVEGVHLRFGPVARGGLRWSDRRDDFRTEVLGLVKAQQVKNAVIVPVGSKGGFFPKLLTPKATREEAQAIGIAAYKVFVGALLQLTDNIVSGKTVRPARLVAWDGDDPYLVVAADKGTAAFSDIANGLSADWKFWLGDAFASGGSVGYDHKKMGITARGAWEAVKRHFRELGTDIQTEPFRVIGIGDMSGDVFGNGMLLSKAINLVAAFDHRHIFLDPTPDAATSFKERQRMFALPRSSWADYNSKLISRGGGVFDRSAKSIPLSPEVRVMTGLAEDSVTPDQLIKALLQAECDLLWFGGIGTYIKASTQSNVDVGDKTNDLLRVDAKDVKAKVIGEGANLGLTQAARIEFAHKGGKLNTDAIDNSAGVDSSDHEVNIKILLSEAIQAKDLRAEDRNALLASMTDDVAAHVLRNNYDQTEALSIMEASAAADLDSHERFIESLESRGRLDRTVEGLPTPEQFRNLRERSSGLTRPELAVIMAYAKLDLFDALISSTGPDDPTFESLLIGYFPDELTKFDKARKRHRLRREIIATRLSNRIVNMTGPSFVAQKRDAEGVDPGRLARAVEAAHAVFHFDDLHARIDALDGKAPAAAQTMMQVEMSANLRMLASAFAAEQPLMDQNAGAIVERYRDKVREIRGFLPKALSPLVLSRVEARAERYRIAGAPEDLARDVAMVRALAAARETIDIADRTKWPLAAVAYIQHETGRQLGLDRMRAAARDLEPRDHWDRLALQRVADDLPRQQSELAISAIAQAQKDGVPAHLVDKEVAARIVTQWIEPRRELVARLTDPMGSFDRQGVWSLAKLVLLGDAVREFVYASRSDPAKAAGRR
jgi:glutamate dehydrogenase